MSEYLQDSDVNSKLNFLTEIEKLKEVYRGNAVLSGNRNENSAEHTWHTVMMAWLLSDRFEVKEVDQLRIFKMLLVHDIVEIDHGDQNVFLRVAAQDEKEKACAARVFGLLPEVDNEELHGLWAEFESQATTEARYAKAIDAMQPLLNHYVTGDERYNELNLTRSMVIEKKQFIRAISQNLWEITIALIDLSVKKGLYENHQENDGVRN